MGQEAVQGILEGLKIHAQKVRDQNELQLRRDELKSQDEDRKARIADEQAKQLEAHNQNTAYLGLAQQAAKVAHLAAMSSIQDKYQQTGNLPPGASVAPAGQDTGNGGFTPIDRNAPGPQTLTIPGMGVDNSDLSFQVVRPEDYATRKADLERITDKPKVEAKIQEERARQEEIEKGRRIAETERATREQANKDSDYAKAMAQKAADDARAEKDRASREKIAKMEIDGRANIANSKFNPSLFGAATIPERDTIMANYHKALLDGTISAEQMKKDFASKGLQGADAAIMIPFMQAGLVPPNDKQTAFIQSIKPIVDMLPDIQSYIGMLPKTDNGIMAMVKGATTNSNILNPELEAKLKQIHFNVATVAKNLSGDQGQRLQKALLEPAEGGFMPDKGKTTKYNVSNFNRFVDTLESAIDQSLGNLPAAQREHVKRTLGLDKISKLGDNGIPSSIPAAAVDKIPAKSGEIHWIRDASGKLVQAPQGQ